MRRGSACAVAAAAVVVLDQITKAIVVKNMRLGQSIRLIDDLLSLTYIRNTGIAFGMFNDGRGKLKLVILTAATVAALAFLIWLLRTLHPANFLAGPAIGLVCGGAVGNLIDRVRLGEVIDFIDLHWKHHHWPFFNVADSAISVGVVVLLALELIHGATHKEA